MKINLFKKPNQKTRRFLLFLPVITIPFLTLIFWIMGGGKGNDVNAKTTEHLLSSLPQVNLSSEKGLDKMKYYDRASEDSLKYKEFNKDNNYWEKNYLDNSDLNDGEPATIYHSESQEKEFQSKLDKLNKVINTPQGPDNYSESTSDASAQQIKSVQDRLNTVSKASDPELEQLNGMLEKIWQIQNPNSIKQNFKEPNDNNPFNAIPAVIEGKQKIGQGSVVKLRLLEEINIQGQTIPKGHFLFGLCRLSNQRIQLDITNIRLGKSIIPVDFTTYDMLDGMEGINAPDALVNDALNSGSNDAIQSLQLLSLDQSMETQIAGAGISAAKGLFNKKTSRIRVKLKDGYQVLLKNNNNLSTH
ncbi:hypothetical protein A5893_02085 [Pedobacter psychrophilus]|uniref:Conjugative transposon TraM C-terminal domain-containing protein n=1 Tax=Pedobacter psychrophilus TaxID=1826909 RepID=A0A179DN15_9SPHI|nr:conjugative transposon protein TraM [Pedobacter psychrophilus]OAQ41929.1 hypothetical protein A5893_02085 [Pedobacter psychrophilus]